MDNAYEKGHVRPESEITVPIKIPKNIRQVGNIDSHNKIIYVEDYVMTFVKQLAEKDPGSLRVAILLGYYIRTDECKSVFIKGAIEMKSTELSSGIALSDDGWTSIYENIKKYFTDVEIVGWSLIGPEFYLDGEEKIRKVHMDNFSGTDKVLLKMDSMEKEENFYLSERNQLVMQTGYYIYYEKNEEMQSYMVENKEEDLREDTSYSDQTTKKIRSIVLDKKEVKDDRNVVRLLYAASSLMAIIVLVIAATMLDNYDKMKSMETAINDISQTLNTVSNSNSNTNQPGNMQASDDTNNKTADDNAGKQVALNDTNIENETGETSDTQGQEDNKAIDGETTQVETVEGNIVAKDDNASNETGTNEDASKAADNEGANKEDANGADANKEDANSSKDTNTTTETVKDTTKEEDSVQTSAQPSYYTVQAGDTLASISMKLYNTYAYMDDIKELNGIEDENLIMQGQKLKVP